VRSSLQFMGKNAELGLDLVFQMIVIAVCISVGLFLATIVVWPYGNSKSKTIDINLEGQGSCF
jgi:hypothetical protein